MLAWCVVVALVLVVVFKGRQKHSNGNYFIVICYVHIFSFFFQISENDDLTATKNEAYDMLTTELTVTTNEAYGMLTTEPAYEVRIISNDLL